MQSKPLVSVIVVNYNGAAYIVECIDSVLKSDGNFEILVLDNGSSDKSWSILTKSYQGKSKVKLIRSETNLLFAGGSNYAAQQAAGKKLLFLNSDTRVEKNWITELLKLSGKHEKILVQPKILQWGSKIIDNVGGKFIWPGFGMGLGRGEKSQKYSQDIKVDYANGTCFMIDKAFFNQLGGFDEQFGFFYEDVDLNLRAKKQKAEAWTASKSIIEHQGGTSFKENVVSDKVLFYVRRNRLINVIKNFKGLSQALRVIAIFLSYAFLARKKASLTAIKAAFQWCFTWQFNQIRIKEVKKVLSKSPTNWLDLGCGDKALIQAALEQGIKAKGYDKNSGHPIEELELKQSFEVISLYHVLEHTKDPDLVLDKTQQWLTADGLLVIEVPLINNLSAQWLGKNYLACIDPTHKHFFSKEDLMAIFKTSCD